jgi:hypothetical protein
LLVVRLVLRSDLRIAAGHFVFRLGVVYRSMLLFYRFTVRTAFQQFIVKLLKLVLLVPRVITQDLLVLYFITLKLLLLSRDHLL